MKNHARGKGRKGGPGYRTPSAYRFTAMRRTQDQRLKNKFTGRV